MASHSAGQIALTNDRWGLELWGRHWRQLLSAAMEGGWVPHGALLVGAGPGFPYEPCWHQTVVMEGADARALGQALTSLSSEAFGALEVDRWTVDAVIALCRVGAFRIYNSQVDLSTICECGRAGDEHEDLPPASELAGDHLRPDPADEALPSLAEVGGPARAGSTKV